MGMGGISIWAIITLILLPLFLLPSIIAFKKNHKHKIPIMLLNIFGGMVFGIGWIPSMIWCFWPQKTVLSSSDIEKLEKLKELSISGTITPDEYEQQKARIMKSVG
jgi:hypothetical protein